MFRIRGINKTLFAVPLAVVMTLANLPNNARALPVSRLIELSLFGGEIDINPGALLTILLSVGFVVLFNILYGNTISNEFRYCSVYVFTRIANRCRWFICKVAELLIYAVCYSVLIIAAAFGMCALSSSLPVDSAAYMNMPMQFVAALFLLFTTTLLINLISMRLGSSAGFISVYSTVIILISLLTLVDIRPPWLRLLNPMICLSLPSMGRTHMIFTLCYDFTIAAAVLIAGIFLVKRFNIALFDSESN